jgi:uncharacterized membrane protein YjgN (DUF898 family)
MGTRGAAGAAGGAVMAATCPRCGAPSVTNDKCAQCGVVASVYTKALEKMRRPPTPSPPASSPMARAAAPPAAPPAAAVAVSPAPRRPDTNGSVMVAAAPAARDLTLSTRRKLAFHGTGGTLFGIYVVNVLLTIVTLGFYRFWGRVKVRRFMMSQTGFEGDRFAYHGTGKELLNGFFKAGLFLGMPVTLLGMVDELAGDRMIHAGIRFLSSTLVFIFIPVAMVGARRYRLSRTSWRGIRFSFRGRVKDFIKLFTRGSLLSMLTLSLYYPFFQARQQHFMISHSHFGRRPFRFDGRGRDLFGSYVLTLLLVLPTLGLYWFWFSAKKTRYFWEHTFFETARFRCSLTGRQLMNFTICNWLILVVTLGLAWPWVLVRSSRFAFSYLSIDGPLDLDGIVQEPQLATATGDALSSILGTDVDFGA